VLFAVPALPQSPDNLSVKEVTCSSVTLAWNSSTDTTMTPVRSYVIQYRRNGSDDDYVETSVSKPEVTVGGLSAETDYEFQVFSVNDVGRSITAAFTVVTTSHTGQAITLFSFIFTRATLC